MGFLGMQLWLAEAILLLILHLLCIASSAQLPFKDFIGIHDSEGNTAHREGFRGERHAVPRRSRSYLETTTSEGNGTTTEAESLLAFRDGVSYDPFDFFSSWTSSNTSNYCSWTGVRCSSPEGQVTSLNVSGQQLLGVISPSLGGLQFLTSLDLSQNDFQGGIPVAIANCSNLTVLDLSSNALKGAIPPLLLTLSALRVLDLAENELGGKIVSLAWAGLGKLEMLNLRHNSFWGGIPESLSNCSSLNHLDLAANNFTGTIPNIFQGLQKLQKLKFWGNFLTGSIPRSLGALQSLRLLSLGRNLLSGDIPTELGNLQNLSYLSLEKNTLTGFIPPSIGNCYSLTDVFLFENRLSGEIPAGVGLLSRLQALYLWNNSLTGSIPSSLLNCTSLTDIIFSYNFLSGEIPQALGKLSKLQFLYLGCNLFNGVIPASLGEITTLEEVHLDNNQLVGTIPPGLGLLQNLSVVDLSSNFLDGSIPLELGLAGNLIFLSLAKNQLSGQIPPAIGRLATLRALNLSGNALSGPIPAALSHLSHISELDLSRNFLTGSIPDELGNLTTLNKLFLNNNQFTGSIPAVVRHKLTNLKAINVAYNNLSDVIAEYDFGPLQNLVSLDMSYNLFSGALPAGIAALQVVEKINMSFNAFSGQIPGSFSRCIALQSLDLSSNNLDGKIPAELTSLQELAYFNVSFNNLTGSVPRSGSFAHFNSSSYLGNLDLCGSMLPKKCEASCRGIKCHSVWIVVVPAVAAGAVALAAILVLIIAKRRDASAMVAPSLPSASHFTREIEGLSIGDIVASTNGFSDGNIMGVGSKSTVFTGVLSSGITIAVKRLELGNEARATAQLYRELQRLSKVEHPNLLKVHGAFSTGDLKLLVLEHMPNGSLHKQMHEGQRCRLSWAQRLRIALGVAEGMVHLHSAHSKPIIHQDLKPSNILLDSNMEPKVSDYGIVRNLNHESHVDTTIASNLYGTIGYIPPEYGTLARETTLGDVYNFGMVLLELITRRQPTDDLFGQEVSLQSWVVNAFPRKISQILDIELQQELAQNEQEVGIHLIIGMAIVCTRSTPKERPTMVQARDMLLEIRAIEQPLKSGR